MFSIDLQGRLGPEPQYPVDEDERVDRLWRTHYEECEQCASDLLRTCLATGHLAWTPRVHQLLTEEHRSALEAWQIVARRKGVPREVACLVLSYEVGMFPADRLVRYEGVCKVQDDALVIGIAVGGLQSAKAREFTPMEALPVVKKAAAGLQWLHEHGIMHKRLRAASIFVSPDLQQVKLAWYGLPTEHHMERRNIADPYWLAPELVTAPNLDFAYTQKCDMWALGITAIELATGANPWEHLHPVRALFILGSQQEAPRLVGEEYPAQLRRLVESCVRPDPERRSVNF